MQLKLSRINAVCQVIIRVNWNIINLLCQKLFEQNVPGLSGFQGRRAWTERLLEFIKRINPKSKPALDRDKNDGQELEKRDYRSFGISWINYENKIRDYFYKKCKKTFWTIKLYFGQLNYIFWTIKLYVHHPYRLGVGQTFQLSACNQTASYNPSNLIITRLKSKSCWMKL